MQDQKISITKGDTENITLTITDELGNPFDITGYTVTFTVKKKIDDPDSKLILQKTTTSHINPTQGQTIISLTETDTDITPSIYIYDVQISKSSPTFIRTVLKGIFEIVEDVTD